MISNIIIDIIDPLYCEPLYLLLYFECFLIISNLKINEFKKRNIVLNIKFFIGIVTKLIFLMIFINLNICRIIKGTAKL